MSTSETIPNRGILIHPTPPAYELPIVPAARGRAWHKHIPATGACLPLTISNQAGWWLLNPEPVEIFEDCGSAYVSWPTRVPEYPHIASHFGHGIITVLIPYIFRTPPGWQLQIRGPANYFYDGMQPFEGIVETDHNNTTATMNWRVHKDADFRIEAGEPLVQITPLRLADLETFAPQIVPMPDEMALEYEAFQQRRATSLSQPEYKFERNYAKSAEKRKIALDDVKDLR